MVVAIPVVTADGDVARKLDSEIRLPLVDDRLPDKRCHHLLEEPVIQREELGTDRVQMAV
jgi:hypothetical protein